MANVLTSLTEVADTIETIVSRQVQMVLTAEMIVPGTIMDYSSEVGPGMDTLKIPRFSNFTVDSKSENVAVDAQANAFSADSLSLSSHKVVQFLIEDIANIRSKIAFTQEYINQAGRDLAADLDDVLITAMEASPSAAAPDHIQDFSNTPTDTLSKDDFLNAKKLLSIQKVPLTDRFCLISPLRESDVLGLDQVSKVNESGSNMALRNGSIGRLYGFEVIVSPLADDDATLFYHKSTHAFARQLMPRVQQESDLPNLAMRWSIDHIFGNKALDSGKRIVRIKDGGA